ncbi:MAG TPA: thymidine phosphorylase [Candidatus Faecimonas gallistercoris]|nr:thymidine phosphorylase [Candidatus Faecimonas gallistercoris]
MIVDIINKKRLGKELSFHELDWFFNGYLEGKVKDYQMASLLMAICIQGMSDEETFALTKVFIDSGDTLDLSFLNTTTVDKHSTGGIGDKTTLIIAPIVASVGIPILKMSGRGLGYTGGTIDKLESIPGFRVDLSEEEVMYQVQNIGIVITGQTASLAPMDKKIYALRDVTGTVSSIPLIASSIMSKKIAGGTDKILIDIKVGNGALLQTKEDAQKLSDLVIKIGDIYQKEVHTIISDMNTPLGYCIGNSLEVMEAIKILKGEEKDNNLTQLCLELASEMICMAKGVSKANAIDMVRETIESGNAYQKFLELVEAQHGDLDKLSASRKSKIIKSPKDGQVQAISAIELGKLSVLLGAGRLSKEDSIDYGVGVELLVQVGDSVKKGDSLAKIYYTKAPHLQGIEDIFVIK